MTREVVKTMKVKRWRNRTAYSTIPLRPILLGYHYLKTHSHSHIFCLNAYVGVCPYAKKPILHAAEMPNPTTTSIYPPYCFH
jgi:hypothetical protein